jgi:histone H3/H4
MDYLDWLEAEYDIRIDARDLSDSIHENVDQYQAEFDAMVLDFYDAVDKIEKEAFDTCDSIEERNSSDADERMNEVLRETSDGISKESGRLAERLNSLNQKFSRRPSSSLLRQSTTM